MRKSFLDLNLTNVGPGEPDLWRDELPSLRAYCVQEGKYHIGDVNKLPPLPNPQLTDALDIALYRIDWLCAALWPSINFLYETTTFENRLAAATETLVSVKYSDAGKQDLFDMAQDLANALHDCEKILRERAQAEFAADSQAGVPRLTVLDNKPEQNKE